MDANNIPEEALIDGVENNGDISREGEGCGICSDLVMDRGVLDCCDHWFCFTCIDHWAGITNLCPLCKSEFQLITCVPVYDTIGNNTIMEDSFLRDDDWSIQGENNTLSFPSYYIDENAVTCLDGDGCKIKSGPAEMEDNLLLDTSIACDSCDLWYHAFCVGFIPEATSESSWLCPRCISDVEHRKPNLVLIEDPGKLGTEEEKKEESLSEATLSGKVSITVADAGETAVVVSMVGQEPIAVSLSNSMDRSRENDTTDGRQPTWLAKPDTEFSNRDIGKKSGMEPGEDVQEAASATELKQDMAHLVSIEPTKKASTLSHAPGDSSYVSMPLFREVHLTSTSNIECYQEYPLDSTVLESTTGSSPAMEQVAIGDHHQFYLEGSSLSGDKSTSQTSLSNKEIMLKEKPEIRTAKRKYLEKLSQGYDIEARDDDAKMEIDNPVKKCRLDWNNGENVQHHSSVNYAQVEFASGRKSSSPDIMSIVREGKRQSKGSTRRSPIGETSEGRENINGFRVKKIMRRAVEDKESLLVLQKLRQEMKEAIQSKTSISKNDLVNEKLLTAFRAAMAGPGNGHMMKSSSSPFKSKNRILQKGKARENLTKKIYGTASGKRRRAWDRDWEVEFWKHRCMHTAPEKVETLKSVIDLLKRSSDSGSSVNEKRSDIDDNNSILSRLYLADASVFPRKEGLKPVSILSKQGKEREEQEKQENTSSKVSFPVQDNNKTVTQRDKDTVVGNSPLNLKDEKKLHSNEVRGSGVLSTPLNGSRNSALPKENPSKSTGSLIDKKKWALEVLARKNVSTNKGPENQEDNATLKTNYPLLAQLPLDMHPEMIAIHKCKVPLSVRQAQLYRISELYLRKTDIPVIQRTAETELAIADAVNVEKEICEKSNSKLEYLNLCSHVISQHKSGKQPKKEDDKKEEGESSEVPCDNVQEALKLAGLGSDSPPSSPHVTNDTGKNDACNPKIESEEHESIFDLDSHPDFDIFGNFEYDIDDDEYAGPTGGMNTCKSSQLQLEESDSKMKVVLSNVTTFKAPDRLEHAAEKVDSSIVELKLNSLDDDRDNAKYSLNRNPDVDCQATICEKNEEISLVDYEELYGMEKEPLANQYIFDAPIAESIISAAEISKSAENENQMKDQFVVATSSACNDSFKKDLLGESMMTKETNVVMEKESDVTHSVSKKVEAYVKEHIRPLCKSGVISVKQYRWAVAKTTDKVMKFHSKEKNANFLIKEGDKVKKLAEQYVEAAQEKR